MGSGETIAVQTSLKRFPKIPFAYKRASVPFLRQTCCPVYEQRCEATGFLFGKGGFHRERRLTGFRGARKIIRIRTNAPAADNSEFSTLADHGTRHRYPFGRSTV
jgi:hypothetical protein